MLEPIQPLILLADDDPDLIEAVSFHLRRWNYQVDAVQDRKRLSAKLQSCQPALLLLDLQFGADDGLDVYGEVSKSFPELLTVFLTAHGSIDVAVRAVKMGAFDFLSKPPDLARLRMVVMHAVEKYQYRARLKQLEDLVESRGDERPMLGRGPAMQRVREAILEVAPTSATVLIHGESGVGKELVAREIHERSGRARGLFVPVNMAALPGGLVESALFGHERGAFTGAEKSQKGWCELAHRGTLFLDEIGDMEFGLQAKLLRFLQDQSFQRVGSNQTLSVDARIVAATNRDPRRLVDEGRLRADLFYRLNVVPIALPPLRERRDDIELMANWFLRKAAEKHGKTAASFSPAATRRLTAYDWPGNVRQLENVVQRMVIFGRGEELGTEGLPPEILEATRDVDPTDNALDPRDGDPEGGLTEFERMEKKAIVESLARSGDNVVEAARFLGIGAATVYRKLKRFGIELPREIKERKERK